MSGISVNTGEERLLSTSFITSLLAQTPDPFATVRPPTAWNRHGHNHKLTYASSDGTSIDLPSVSGRNDFAHIDPTDSRKPPAHHSVPQSIHPSEAYVNTVQDSISSDPRKLENASIITGSVRTSDDYSETLHSEEHVQSLVRSPSVLAKR